MSSNIDDLLAEFSELPATTHPKGASQSAFKSPPRGSTRTSAGSLQPGSLAQASSRPTALAPVSQESKPSSQATRPHHHHSASLPSQHDASTSSQPSTKSRDSWSRSAGGALQESLDELLSDLDLPAAPDPAARSFPRSTSGSQQPSNPKCMGLYLGGATMPRGRNGAEIGTLLCCDALRCTKCDFKVISFPNRAWHPDVEYLFFRNMYPTESKLSPKLDSQTGACAYACQCTWRTVSGSEGVRVDSYSSDLRWICGGHAS